MLVLKIMSYIVLEFLLLQISFYPPFQVKAKDVY
jgi:hypothetical protein